MATPTSPIGFSDIYSEANGTAPVSATSLSDLTNANSWFQGPNGANTIGFNAWGQQFSNDGIYAVQGLTSAPISFNNYRNISYFYDQSQYQISLEVANNSGNAYDVTMYYMDTNLIYNYLVANTGGPVGGGTTFGPSEVSISTTPLIYGCNWKIQIDPPPGYTSGNTFRLDINGNTLFTGEPIAAAPAPTFQDYNAWGNEYMTLDQPVSGATGSLIYVRIS
jgi:hypothetical protein